MEQNYKCKQPLTERYLHVKKWPLMIARRSKLEKKMKELSGKLSPEKIIRGERSRSKETHREKRQRTRERSVSNERSPNRWDDSRRSHDKSSQKKNLNYSGTQENSMAAHKVSMESAFEVSQHR